MPHYNLGIAFPGHTQPIESVGLSPDGMLALAGSQDKTLRIWQVETGNELQHLIGHTHYVRCVSFSPDGRQVLSRSGASPPFSFAPGIG
jgi:WD40 repeat protein